MDQKFAELRMKFEEVVTAIDTLKILGASSEAGSVWLDSLIDELTELGNLCLAVAARHRKTQAGRWQS